MGTCTVACLPATSRMGLTQTPRCATASACSPCRAVSSVTAAPAPASPPSLSPRPWCTLAATSDPIAPAPTTHMLMAPASHAPLCISASPCAAAGAVEEDVAVVTEMAAEAAAAVGVGGASAWSRWISSRRMLYSCCGAGNTPRCSVHATRHEFGKNDCTYMDCEPLTGAGASSYVHAHMHTHTHTPPRPTSHA